MRLDFEGIIYHNKTNYTMSWGVTNRIMIIMRLVIQGVLMTNRLYIMRLNVS